MTDDFDVSSLDAQDEATLAIKHPKTDEVTTWLWTFYGPGHARTIELANKASKEILTEQRDFKQSQLNFKKVKIEVETLDEIRAKNADSIVARTKTFTPIRMDGETIEFSAEAAKRLLMDRRKGWLMAQISDYLKEEANFIQPSASS